MSFSTSLRRLFGRPYETAVCMNSSYFGFFAHAGFIKGLHDIGVRPAHVSGASAGALVAGVYASGLDPDEMIAQFLDPKLKKVFAEWRAPFRMGALMANRRGFTGALQGNRAIKHIRGFLGDRRIEDCVEPTLSIAVANLTQRSTEVVRKGPLIEYMMASCALPVMFKTQEIQGSQYWDGGIADPAPFEHWLDNPRIRRIILHLVNSNQPDTELNPRLSLLDAVGQSHEIISEELIRLKLRLAAERGKEVIVLETRTPRLSPTKLKNGGGNVELGRRTALDNADRLSI